MRKRNSSYALKIYGFTPLEWFLLLNVFISWYVSARIMIDDEYMMAKANSQVSECSYLWHLVYDHGYSENLLNGCEGVEIKKGDLPK